MSPVSRKGPVPTRTIVLHDRMEPPLVAGDYEVRVSQTVGGDPDLGAVPDDVRHVRVTGPRYRLAATEVLSTFPPANGDGPFTTRLAQVALRRKTLPWERAASPERPWLALVLLSDAEGTYLPSVPVEQAVTAGVRLTGPNPDGATCAAVEVPVRVVRQLFPSRQDLPFTCHVREVPLDDTELAQGDDDGWVAVVLGTRLPRPGMRYRACLVSLEGQWDQLPDNPPVEERITKTTVYELADRDIAQARLSRSDGVLLKGAIDRSRHAAGGGLAPKLPKDAVDREEVEGLPAPASSGHAAADAWTAPATPAPAAAQAAPVPASAATWVAGLGSGSVILDVSFEVIDPGARLLRFPVLMSWEFRCEGDQDFATLVQDLDVGLLGTAPASAGPTDRIPAVAETGHVVLGGTDRAGGVTSSWYRGPFVPRAIERRPATAVHVSDQLRRVAEDGRAEVGEAAAFELGRLLALSSPSTVASLCEWRRRKFTARRAGEAGSAAVFGTLATGWALVENGVLTVDSFATALGHTLLATVGGDTVDALLPARPAVDPLPDLDLLRDPAATISRGLGMPLRQLRASLEGGTRPEVTAELLAPVATVGFEALAKQPGLLAPLAAELAARVGELTADVGRFGGPTSPAMPHPDAPTAGAATDDTVEALFPGAQTMEGNGQ